jgi:hypothetical protein
VAHLRERQNRQHQSLWEQSFWIQKFREMYLGQRPFNTLDQIVGNTTTVFQKWLQHPAYDSYWEAMAPTPEQYAKSVSVL